MRSICPGLFPNCNVIDSLDNLITRLNLPMYSDYHGGNEYYDAKLCRQYARIVARQDLAKKMGLVGIGYGRQLAHREIPGWLQRSQILGYQPVCY